MHPLLKEREARLADTRPSAALIEHINKQKAEREATKTLYGPRPDGWKKPEFRSDAYMDAMRIGWITYGEYADDLEKRHVARARAIASRGKDTYIKRHDRPAPKASKQYAGHMATTAARDDRLTPQAKALLQVIRARCGNGHQTYTTKGTLGNIMSRCERSIQRYISELKKFGYIKTEIKTSAKGFYLCLRIFITELVEPFFKDDVKLAEWLESQGICDETSLSYKNYNKKILSIWASKNAQITRNLIPI